VTLLRRTSGVHYFLLEAWNRKIVTEVELFHGDLEMSRGAREKQRKRGFVLGGQLCEWVMALSLLVNTA
jgi:hypothetical protein